MSYDYEFNWICNCVDDFNKRVRISVENEIISGVVDSETQIPIPPENVSRYRTVNGLFDFLQEAMDRDAFEFEVTYDLQLGYPISASIDYVEQIAGDEMSFTVHELSRQEFQ